jgi:hypothetical protein|tara:strand:+ start:231 stop:515 length:285 start_codon:yes stop_codon:yes gene_type:complete
MNVKLIRIITGEEVVAELVEESSEFITVRNGLVALPQAQSVGFMPWATVIDKQAPDITLSKTHVVYIAEVDPGVKNKYSEMFGGITTPDKKLII